MISVEIHCVTAVTVFVSDVCHVEIGKNHVHFQRIRRRFPVFWLPRWRIGGAISAVAWCNAAVSMCYSSDCELVCGENVVWKRQKCMRFLWFGSIYKRFHVLFR